MYILRQDKQDDQFDEVLRDFGQGEFIQECLDKIQQMNGEIVAADMRNGMSADLDGETLFFVCGQSRDLFHSIRTDDSAVSRADHGRRFVDGRDVLMEMLLEKSEHPLRFPVAA